MPTVRAGRYRHDPDGTSDVANEVLWSGRRLDPETGLYLLGGGSAWHATLGRPLSRPASPDPSAFDSRRPIGMDFRTLRTVAERSSTADSGIPECVMPAVALWTFPISAPVLLWKGPAELWWRRYSTFRRELPAYHIDEAGEHVQEMKPYAGRLEAAFLASIVTGGSLLPTNRMYAVIHGVDVEGEFEAAWAGAPAPEPLDAWDRVGHGLIGTGQTIGLSLLTCSMMDVASGVKPGLVLRRARGPRVASGVSRVNPKLAARAEAYKGWKARAGIRGKPTAAQFRRFMGAHRPASRGVTLYPKNTSRFLRWSRRVGGMQNHHVQPIYLGGARNGPTVLLHKDYHQLITNEFRKRWQYGSPQPDAAELQRIMAEVYQKYPLP